jgi:hypothetical protein
MLDNMRFTVLPRGTNFRLITGRRTAR